MKLKRNGLIIIILFILILLILFNNKKNQDMNIYYGLNVVDKCLGNYEKYYEHDKQKIYLYCLKEVNISNNYSLKDYLKSNKDIDKSINDLISRTPNLSSSILWDGGTTEYKNSNVTIIVCNTLEGNKDIFFGPSDMNVNYAYKKGICGKEKQDTNFKKIFLIEKITKGNKENEYILNLKDDNLNGEVKIETEKLLEENNYYEFSFDNVNYNIDENNIDSIFKNSTLVDIEKQ